MLADCEPARRQGCIEPLVEARERLCESVARWRTRSRLACELGVASSSDLTLADERTSELAAPPPPAC